MGGKIALSNSGNIVGPQTSVKTDRDVYLYLYTRMNCKKCQKICGKSGEENYTYR